MVAEAEAIVDAALDTMVSRNGELDNVMVGLLMLLSISVRTSCGQDHTIRFRREFGLEVV
ncbi:MAG: hypothetical protein P0Y64_17490 [Candidatus Sphingomonas colombiensis]|nr:hypothetical protein [Sphingomonas sp.]WEK43103.1 MAG: hypothetical protein P0Y64_17490 [Sphingomonas sp.]